MEKDVYDILKKLSIEYETVSHPFCSSSKEADKYIVGKDGVRTKSLFLCDRKKRNFYLVVMDDEKDLNIKTFEETVNNKGIHFCSSETLKKKMNLEPNTITIFGLINNIEKDIKIYIDEDVLKEKRITFHPNINTKTIFISIEDMIKFLKYLECEYHFIAC